MALWRLGVAFLGGRWIAASALGAIVVGYAALLYAGFSPLRRVGGIETFIEMAALLVTVVFLATAFAPTALRTAWRTHPMLRLAPGARGITSALTRRLVAIALIALVPSLVLRALLSIKFGNSVDATISLADVTLKNCVLTGLYLAHVVVLIKITFGEFKLSSRSAFLPICYGAMQWSSTGFVWLPFATCVVLITGHFLWPILVAWVGEKPYGAKPQNELKKNRTPWWTAHLQRRAASAVAGNDGASMRIAALLASNSQTPSTLITGALVVMYLVFKPGFMDDLIVSWLLVVPIAALLARLSPIPLARIILLPLGAQRPRMGAIIAGVWVRELTERMLIFSVIGLALHTLCWGLQWPAYIRSPFFASVSVSTQLLWSPLAQSIGLYGLALSVCLLCSAWPRMLETAALLRIGPFVAIVILATVGIALKWTLNQLIPGTNTHNMGHITFAVVNGAMLPAFAWCVHRAARRQWHAANLNAISAAMQVTSRRLQPAFSPD